MILKQHARTTLPVFLIVLLVAACKVVFITGYDQVIDETTTKIKSDFNLHFIKLKRTIQDSDPQNQKFENFQEYYDQLEADLFVLEGRAKSLGAKSTIVKKQIATLDSVMLAFVDMHKTGFTDRPGDDRRDIRNGVNSAIDAVIKLQLELKSTGKIESDK